MRSGWRAGRSRRLARAAFHHLAVLDDDRHRFQDMDVGERIAIDRDQGGVAARGNRTDVRGPTERLGRTAGRRLDGLHRSHPPLDHLGELPRVQAVWIDARVGAEQHLYTCGMCGAKGLALLAADDLLLRQALGKHSVPFALGKVVVVIVDVHVEPGALFLRELETLGIGEARVLDGIDTGAQRIVDAIGAVRVHGHPQPEPVGFLHDRLDFVERQLLRADGVALGQHPTGHAHLDDLGAVLVDGAYPRPVFIRRVCDLRVRGDDRWRELGRIAVPTGGADGVGGRYDARSRNVTLLDALL